MSDWKPTAVGGALGLAAGAAWWFGYACTTCGAGGSPVAVLVFSTAVSALMARRFSRDWAPPEPR